MIRNAVFCHEADEGGAWVPGERGFAEMRILRNVVVRQHRDIREIAATAPRNPDLLSYRCVVFKDKNGSLAFPSFDGAHESRRPATNDDNVMVFQFHNEVVIEKAACTNRRLREEEMPELPIV